MLDLSSRLKFGYLPAKPSDILTSSHQLFSERTLFPLIRKLGKGILCPVVLLIWAQTVHISKHIHTPFSLVFEDLTQVTRIAV